MEEFIVPLNLKSQRESRKMRQEDLAEALEITRVHVSRLETGARGMSFILALKCAKLFGSLRVRLGEDVFEIAPVNGIDPKGRNDIPDDEELHDLNDVEHNLNVLNQAADVVQVMSKWPDPWHGRTPTKADVAAKVREEWRLREAAKNKQTA